MRKVEYNCALTIKLSQGQRQVIEKLAESRELTLGAAARSLIQYGIDGLGLHG